MRFFSLIRRTDGSLDEIDGEEVDIQFDSERVATHGFRQWRLSRLLLLAKLCWEIDRS